jgi:hypothetical protein
MIASSGHLEAVTYKLHAIGSWQWARVTAAARSWCRGASSGSYQVALVHLDAEEALLAPVQRSRRG